MARIRASRRTVVTAVVGLVAGAGPAVASASTTERLVLRDIAGDANAVNDQGEGLVGNVATSSQVAQADLRSITLRPMTDADGHVTGLRLAVTTTARPAPLADGTPLAYGVVLQPAADCRFVVEHVTHAVSPTGQRTPAAGRLRHSCDDGRYVELPLHTTVEGRTATVDVPYSVLPAQAQRGAEARGPAAYVRTAPFGQLNRSRPVEIDGARTAQRYAFPG